MGVDEALGAWRSLARLGGYLAFTELVWLTPDPPNEAAGFFAKEYSAMRYSDAVAAAIEAAGYTLLDRFVPPDRLGGSTIMRRFRTACRRWNGNIPAMKRRWRSSV